MKTKSYVIPTEVDEFIDFESTLIYLLHLYASEWNIPKEMVSEILEKRDQFEYVFFHSFINGCSLQLNFHKEFHLTWMEFKLLLSEFYERYLIHNEAIGDDYKSILSIHTDKYCDSKIRVNKKQEMGTASRS